MIEPPEQRNPVEVLAEEFLERRRCGEPVHTQEYAAAHPELADEIRRLFPAVLAMEHVRTSKLSSSGRPLDVQIDALDQLGDFRIIGEIGRGGMGVVYEAEQQSLRRRVAVKVLPQRVLSNSRRLRRFQTEAQTAAGLHHTNIVPVFGFGEQDGFHYYVMQRICGAALDQVFTANRPPFDDVYPAWRNSNTAPIALEGTTNVEPPSPAAEAAVSERTEAGDPAAAGMPKRPYDRTPTTEWSFVADIGVQVADALAYAHKKGVLHQDIKPGNLLLDPRGTVWVTDFGLATVLNSDADSELSDITGTLRFMAPEHIRGRQNTSSDLYSLGATLYELLTLQPAFTGSSRAAVIHRILNGTVAPPSTLRPEIPQDLEAIVLKSMALEPSQRYENATALGDDLQRFIDGRPVVARPVGMMRRFRLWTRRNPVVASLSATLIMVVVASFLLVSMKWREAVAENERAEDNLSLALDSLDQMLQRFGSGWMAHPIAMDVNGSESESAVPFQVPVSDHSAAVLLDSLRFYDQFAEQNATNPQLRIHTARVHRRAADILQRLGQFAKAERAYERSLSILNREATDADPSLTIEKAATLNQLGFTMYTSGRFSDAERKFRQAIDTLSASSFADAPMCRAELARTTNNLGLALRLMGQTDEARRSHSKAVRILESLTHAHPQNADYRLALARAYRVYFPFTGRYRPADRARVRTEGIRILRELVREFPAVPDYRCELSELLATVNLFTRGFSRTSQQTQDLEQAVALASELCESYPSIPRYRAVLARTRRQLAMLTARSDREAADLLLLESVNDYRSLAAQFPKVPVYRLMLSAALHDCAVGKRDMEQLEESRIMFNESIEQQMAYVALRPDSTFGRKALVRSYRELAGVLQNLQRPSEAEAAIEKAQELENNAMADNPIRR